MMKLSDDDAIFGVLNLGHLEEGCLFFQSVWAYHLVCLYPMFLLKNPDNWDIHLNWTDKPRMFPQRCVQTVLEDKRFLKE